MKRLAMMTATLALFVAAPAGAACAADERCLNDPLVAPVTGMVWLDYDADSQFDAEDETSRYSLGSVFADYNRDGRRQERETLVPIDADGRYELPVDTRRMAAGETSVSVRFGVDTDPRIAEFGLQCLEPARGCVREVTVEAGMQTTDVQFPVVGTTQINGVIWDDQNENGRHEAGEEGANGLRVFLDDNENGTADPGEPTTYKTNRLGTWTLPVPTRYQAAGGVLPPLILERLAGADCTAPETCRITGLRTQTGHSQDVEFGVARPVVIFSHGYGGSRIVCPGKLMWFNPAGGPDLMDMRLGADGENLREGVNGGTSCSQNASVDGLVMDVAGADIYGSSSRHFEEITWPGRHYDYVWDWRKDPTTAVAGLDELVEKARREHGVKRVVLVGHSMGGLVMRHYIDNPSHAAKVSRAVTVGTPYWGSPKTILPLTAGIEVPWFSAMDIMMENEPLKAASRSYPGHFSLVPAFGYGGWLRVSGMNGGRQLDMDGVREYLRRIGVNPQIYTDAAAQHGRVLDHFSDNGVDFHVIVGGGVPTIGSVALDYEGILAELTVDWVSGDKTVPMFSAAHDTPRDRLHVVCGLEHVPITADPQTTRLMDRFMIRNEPMIDVVDDCPWSAQEATVYYPELTPMAAQAGARKPKVIAGGKTYSLAEAERAEIVQMIPFGAGTTIVAQGGKDVRLELPAGGTVKVRSLTEKGASAEKRFAITAGASVALGGSGAVTGKGGKALKPAAKDKRAPKTTAKVRGGKLVLKAKDASKIAAMVVVVNGKQRAYTKPMKLTAKQLKTATFGSVDIWGNAERPHALKRR